MLGFVVRRLLISAPTLIAVMMLVFFLVRIVPGDPAIVILGNNASEEALTALRARLGVDRPLIEQFWYFLGSLAQGDLGTSIVNGRPVLDEIARVLPYTIDLTLAGIGLGVVTGLPLGVACAIWRNSIIDYAARLISLIGLSFPAFVSAVILLLVFAIQNRWFPVISAGDQSDPVDRVWNLVLPAANLGLIMMAYVTRVARSSMLECLNEDYVRTARAKGLPPAVVIWRHTVRNALIPVVTVIGLYLGVLIGNSVLTEMVFNRPGLGKLMISALDKRDYTLLQGLIVIYAFVIVVVNMITDLAYGLLDPRVKTP